MFKTLVDDTRQAITINFNLCRYYSPPYEVGGIKFPWSLRVSFDEDHAWRFQFISKENAEKFWRNLNQIFTGE